MELVEPGDAGAEDDGVQLNLTFNLGRR